MLHQIREDLMLLHLHPDVLVEVELLRFAFVLVLKRFFSCRRCVVDGTRPEVVRVQSEVRISAVFTLLERPYNRPRRVGLEDGSNQLPYCGVVRNKGLRRRNIFAILEERSSGDHFFRVG